MNTIEPGFSYFPIDGIFPTVGGECPLNVVCVGKAVDEFYILYEGPLVIERQMIRLPSYINVFDENVVCVGFKEAYEQENVFAIVDKIIGMRQNGICAVCESSP